VLQPNLYDAKQKLSCCEEVSTVTLTLTVEGHREKNNTKEGATIQSNVACTACMCTSGGVDMYQEQRMECRKQLVRARWLLQQQYKYR
jgi:hypothetical protein